jgi:hypothetical protein
VERYLVTLLISVSYSENVPSSTITNIPFYYSYVQFCKLRMMSLLSKIHPAFYYAVLSWEGISLLPLSLVPEVQIKIFNVM